VNELDNDPNNNFDERGLDDYDLRINLDGREFLVAPVNDTDI